MIITDEMVVAFADGALEPQELAAVKQALAQDPELRERLDAHRKLHAALSAYYGPAADEPVPEHLRAMLQPQAEVVDLAAAREKKAERQSLFRWPQYGAMAASLAIGLLAGHLAFTGGGPIAMENGAMVARGGLARDLNTQLASAPGGGETRIGLTFPDSERRICRTFDSPGLSGIACQQDGEWRLAMAAAPAGGNTEFRQASAPAVLAQAQEMMAGPSFDAAAERAARDRGWRRD